MAKNEPEEMNEPSHHDEGEGNEESPVPEQENGEGPTLNMNQEEANNNQGAEEAGDNKTEIQPIQPNINDPIPEEPKTEEVAAPIEPTPAPAPVEQPQQPAPVQPVVQNNPPPVEDDEDDF